MSKRYIKENGRWKPIEENKNAIGPLDEKTKAFVNGPPIALTLESLNARVQRMEKILDAAINAAVFSDASI